MSNKTYDILKWIAQIVLPAIGTLYFALAQLWGWAYGEEIVGSITAVDAFLGAVLGISNSTYIDDSKDYDDEADEVRDDIEVTEEEGREHE